ncbi:MAG: response regulator [Nitrospirales bacterium]|nr:response regulator [Nitrospirales bacterium]
MSTSVPRVLLVDDDPVLLQVLCDMLTYRLRPAVVVVHASSDDVVAKVREGNYDVVVCDLKMPRQGGLEVLRLIKAANPDQAVILITGCIEESIEQQAHNQGANAILRKPLDRDEVVNVIRSLVELSRNRAPKLGENDSGELPSG